MGIHVCRITGLRDWDKTYIVRWGAKARSFLFDLNTLIMSSSC